MIKRKHDMDVEEWEPFIIDLATDMEEIMIQDDDEEVQTNWDHAVIAGVGKTWKNLVKGSKMLSYNVPHKLIP